VRLIRLGEIAISLPCDYGDDPIEHTSSAEVVKVSNIDAEGKFHGNFERRSFREDLLPELLVKKGELLVVKSSGSKTNILSGKTAICDIERSGRIVSSNFLLRLRVDEKIAAPRYIWYVLNSNNSKAFVKTIVGTSTYPNIKWDLYSNHPVPLPSFDEQQKIVAILDRAEALRAKRRTTIEKLNMLAQSMFLETFGDPATNPKQWPIRPVKDLLESASYGTSEKSVDFGKFPVLRMNNLTRTGEMDLTDLKYMDLDPNQRERYLVRTGDILFNRTNSAELVGKTAVFRHKKQMAYAGYLIRLRVNNENDPEYLSAFLNTAYSKRVLRGMCKSIIGMANINATEIQSVRIPQPPSSLQYEFAHRIADLEKLKAIQRESLSIMDELFASLQYRAFRGEL
jgi:type I restriction enzyme, S subunit